jgi:ceramide glucosyltransferase
VNALLIAWLLTDCIATFGVWHYLRSLIPLPPADNSPRAAILIAIKGVHATTGQFLELLCQQDYPNYRIIFALESRADPALILIEAMRHRAAGRPEIDIVIAGYSAQRAQKVHNLLAARGALRDEDAVIVFTDADTLLPPDWLTNLVRPIAIGEASASTGYRWPLPTDSRLPTLIGAAADLSITTSARSRHWNICWGGATAVARGPLDRIDVLTVWERAASDDVTLSQALRAAGFRINSPLRTLVPSPMAHTWSSLLGFARRQHLMLRTYAPRLWLFGGLTLCVPTIGAAAALLSLAHGSHIGAAILLSSVVLLQMRSLARRRIAARVLPADVLSTATATIRFASWAWPLIHLVHCIAFLSSCLGRRFTWAGIRYRLEGCNVVVESPRIRS